MYPLVRYGSRGDPVLQHQKALNAWNPGLFPPLVEDAVFGFKTDGATRTFQKQNSLVPDGVVGPKTWAVIQPLIDKLVSLVTTPPSETAFVERAIGVAESALATFGFPGDVVLDCNSPAQAGPITAGTSTPTSVHHRPAHLHLQRAETERRLLPVPRPRQTAAALTCRPAANGAVSRSP